MNIAAYKQCRYNDQTATHVMTFLQYNQDDIVLVLEEKKTLIEYSFFITVHIIHYLLYLSGIIVVV